MKQKRHSGQDAKSVQAPGPRERYDSSYWNGRLSPVLLLNARRPNPYGWALLATSVGLVGVAVFLAVSGHWLGAAIATTAAVLHYVAGRELLRSRRPRASRP